MKPTRRSVLRAGAAGLGAAGAAGAAGCLSDVEGLEGEGGYAAFFALYDWSRSVAGDDLAFENPVDVGEMGHGWSPTGDLLRDVASARVFVYLDSPEFSWAQDVADTLERDYEDEVHVVDVLDGLELLDWDHDPDAAGHDDGATGHEGHDHGDEASGNESHEHDEGASGHDDHDHQDGASDHDGHDHGDDFDPHVWVDPVRAQQMVRTIADGLAEVDPDNAGAYGGRADEYVDRLSEVDARFEDLVAEADLDVAVLAGHDSFQYLADRYELEFHTPAGVSPDEEVSGSDVADTIDLVDELGIDTVLYDAFDAPAGQPPQVAETIVESSDATDAKPISPTEGTTATWNERGWGWVEQMTEVNLPSLRAALQVE